MVPMEVDAARLGQLTEEEKKRMMTEGRCFRCHLQGHLSRNCPKRQETPAPPRTPAVAREATTSKGKQKEQEGDTPKEEPLAYNPEDLITHIRALKDKERDALLDKLMMEEPDF